MVTGGLESDVVLCASGDNDIFYEHFAPNGISQDYVIPNASDVSKLYRNT